MTRSFSEHSFSPLRRTVISLGVVAASLAFVAGGASAAHAEMDPWEAPTQADVDWVPGTGWAGTTGGDPGHRADQFSLNAWEIGYDIWTLNSGYPASANDALLLEQYYQYKSCAPGAQGAVFCNY